MMWNGWGPGSWGMGFGWIFMALFWLLVVVAVVAGVRSLQQRSDPGGRGATGDRPSLEILRERYARGEIGREEYERIKRDLEA